MFSAYPKIKYNDEILTDISRRFSIKNIDTDYSKDIFFYHIITNWKSPENLAYDFYGSCDYIWAITIVNNVVDPVEDWLLPDDEIKKRIERKYGKDMYKIHHYEYNGVIYPVSTLNDLPVGAKKVTNFDYENDINEKKRKVKIIYPELINTFKSQIIGLFA